jgi:hypothetical protein
MQCENETNPNIQIALETLVLFESQLFRIEKDYGNGIYLIGNNLEFVDLVHHSNFNYIKNK